MGEWVKCINKATVVMNAPPLNPSAVDMEVAFAARVGASGLGDKISAK